MNIIPLRDALLEMDKGKPFHIKYVSFNKAKKTGGEIVEIEQGIKCSAKYSLKNNDMISVSQVNNTNHPFPIHIHLITEFNHKRTML